MACWFSTPIELIWKFDSPQYKNYSVIDFFLCSYTRLQSTRSGRCRNFVLVSTRPWYNSCSEAENSFTSMYVDLFFHGLRLVFFSGQPWSTLLCFVRRRFQLHTYKTLLATATILWPFHTRHALICGTFWMITPLCRMAMVNTFLTMFLSFPWTVMSSVQTWS